MGLIATTKVSFIEVRTGLLFLRTGTTGKMKVDDTLSDYHNIRTGTLRVPLNIQYTIPFKKSAVFLFGGAYAGYSLYGSTTIYTKTEGPDPYIANSSKHKISWGKDGDNSPIDFGVNVGAGYEFFRGLSVNAQYSKSFQRIKTVSGIAYNYQSFHFGLAYKFIQQKAGQKDNTL